MAGVGAGTGAMNSLLGKLAALLGDQYRLLKRIRKEVEFLQREIRRMQALLKTLADMHKLEELEKDWKCNVRELTYDIEDCIDRFMDRLGKGDARPGFVRKTVRRLKNLWERHGIATKIKDLKARVIEESQRRDRYKLDNYNPARPVEIDPRLPALYEEAKGLVAIDGPTKQVITWLMELKLEPKVVAIVGGGGLGKTTLAMEVYRKIGEDFQCRASVSVSRRLDLEKLLKDILSQIDEDEFSKCQLEGWEKEKLIRQMSTILKGKRYFIVIDDIWKEQDWKFIKAAFPHNHNGSRIVATTRITKIANSCCSNPGDQIYQMAPLNDVDSRKLFFKRIFHSDNSCPPHLEKVSARILKKCGGLPLAIITIASLLANKPQDIDKWERVQDCIGIDFSHENDDSIKGMRDILLLSFWDLPHHLKTCLLYFCIYPEDHRIPCEELRWKWIAEGFIATQWGYLDQEAENYFNELVNRSLIQLIDVDYNGSVQYCQVHDMVLDIIKSLSDEENFATVLSGRRYNSLPSRIRRLSVQSSGREHKEAIHTIIKSKIHVRSLNVFGEMEKIPPLVDFHSLRVLDLGHANWWLGNKDIKNIGSLPQLRYLRLHSARITELPEEIGKLQHLETLDLRECNSIRTLPLTIVQLQKLARLFISRRLVLPADIFGSMQALEEVSDIGDVDNALKFAKDLRCLRRLRKLSIFHDTTLGKATDGGHEKSCLELLVSSLSELGKYKLQYLHITGDIGVHLFRDPCCTFSHLQDLELTTVITEVPKGMASLTSIVTLDIKVRIFDEEGLYRLMGMPSLVHLQLKLSTPSRVGRKPTVGSNGFKLLKVFHYKTQDIEGTGIAFAPGAMPLLRRLHIHWTAKDVMSGHYDSIDLGIEHLSSLAHLQVETDCDAATLGEVEAVEGSVEKAVALHPNRHTLQVHIRREYEYYMYEDHKEREEMLNILG
ncbi:hypothetical protein ACQ4PT_047500 [Festuca glaucescens]